MARPELAHPVILLTAHRGAGDTVIARPIARRDLVTIGARKDALLEQELGLSHVLAHSPFGTVRQLSSNGEALLDAIEVDLPSPPLPRSLRRVVRARLPIVLSCPHAGHTLSGEGLWVTVPDLDFVLWLDRTELGRSTPSIALVELSATQRETIRALTGEHAARFLATLHLPSADLFALLADADHELVRIEVQPARGASVEGEGRRLEAARQFLTSVTLPVPESDGPHTRQADVEALVDYATRDRRGGLLVVGAKDGGKTFLIGALAERLRSLGRIIVRTHAGRLIAGTSAAGELELRLRELFQSVRALDAVLVLEDLLGWASPSEGDSMQLASALRHAMQNHGVRILSEVRTDDVGGLVAADPALASCFSRHVIASVSPEETLALLETTSVRDRLRGARHTLPTTNRSLVHVARRYYRESALPGRAFSFYRELTAPDGIERGQAVAPDELFDLLARATSLPRALCDSDAPLRVEDVERALSKRVVGQHESIRLVAETVCVIKANVAPEDKPLAVLFFAGPTGVGKTEVARALADYLYGSDRAMYRVDMSEYQGATAGARLFLGTEEGRGVLPARAAEHPFSLFVLDEVEKADPSVADVLLSVLGEGRLSDGRGRTYDFRNSVFVLTSNLGASGQDAPVGFVTPARSPDALVHKALRDHYRPEFINRLDRVVVFHPLSRDETERVLDLCMADVLQRDGVVSRKLTATVSGDVRADLLRRGYSLEYGARAMRRHVEEVMGAALSAIVAELGQTCRDGTVTIERADAPLDRRLLSVIVRDLRVSFQPGERRQQTHGSHTLAGGDPTELSRELRRFLELPSIHGLFDRRAELVAQFARRKSSRTAKGGVEPADELRELSVLDRATGELLSLYDSVYEADERELTRALDGIGGAAQRALPTRQEIDRTLLYALCCRDSPRDAITLLVQWRMGAYGLVLYTAPLIRACKGRGLSPSVWLWDGKKWSAAPGEKAVSALPETARACDELEMGRAALIEVEGPLCAPLLVHEAGVFELRSTGGIHDCVEVYVACQKLGIFTPEQRTQLRPVPPAKLNTTAKGGKARRLDLASTSPTAHFEGLEHRCLALRLANELGEER